MSIKRKLGTLIEEESQLFVGRLNVWKLERCLNLSRTRTRKLVWEKKQLGEAVNLSAPQNLIYRLGI